MFGMGFSEILIIGVIAILFLGPDKLPQTMVEIAKFFKNVKRTISSAKDTIDEELHLNEIKEQALSYKEELHSASEELGRLTSLDEVKNEVNELKEVSKFSLNDTITDSEEKIETRDPEVVTFKKKKRKRTTEYAESSDDDYQLNREDKA